MKNYNNNMVEVSGEIKSEIKFDHEIYGEKFYKFLIGTKRNSGYVDVIPVTVSERVISPEEISEGDSVYISGQFRSYNQYLDGKHKLGLTIFAKVIEKTDADAKDKNEIELVGFLCKEPSFRQTPFGREIADIIFAVNRSYNKSDYIPCILWGRNARYCQDLAVGTKMTLNGRIQSRSYQKNLPDGTVTEKTAYEVSVSRFCIENVI